MSNVQLEIQLIDHSLKDNTYWKQLITMFTVVGLKFEIHCWREEAEVIKSSLKFGKEKTSDWEFGTIIEGVIDDEFLDMLNHTAKPTDTESYNKMTPFFSIFLENGFSSEHYGTEIHILSAPMDNANFISLLNQFGEHAIINQF